MSDPRNIDATGRRRAGAELIDELENLEITSVFGEDVGLEEDDEPGESLVHDIDSWLDQNV